MAELVQNENGKKAVAEGIPDEVFNKAGLIKRLVQVKAILGEHAVRDRFTPCVVAIGTSGVGKSMVFQVRKKTAKRNMSISITELH